jgi:precorrin-6B methylase 2
MPMTGTSIAHRSLSRRSTQFRICQRSVDTWKSLFYEARWLARSKAGHWWWTTCSMGVPGGPLANIFVRNLARSFANLQEVTRRTARPAGRPSQVDLRRPSATSDGRLYRTRGRLFYHPAMTKRIAAPVFAACLIAAGIALHAQDNAADTATLVDVLQLKAGSVVAEIGAGSGELTIAIAKHVGPTGRVLTSELGAERVGRLQQAIERAGVANVDVVEGREADANLPDACCDAIFMRNVYHHFSGPPAMNASFLRALKPGGRIAVIDFPPRNNAATAEPGHRGDNAAHGVSATTATAELKAAGFEIVASEERPNRWFIVVGAKPAR